MEKFRIGDRVQLPFNEIGRIVGIKQNVPWGFRYEVKIIYTPLHFSKKGNISDFKEEQMILLQRTSPISEEEIYDHLTWIYNRLIHHHSEPDNVDYMIKLKLIIDQKDPNV